MQRVTIALFSLVSFLSLSLTAIAAEDRGGALYYNIGGSFGEPGALNTAIGKSSFGPVPSFGWSQGGGGHAVFQRWLVGGEGHGFFNQRVSSGQDSMAIGGGYGLVHFGYMLAHTPSFQLYPMIGLGLGGMSIRSTRDLSPILDMQQGSLPLTHVNSLQWLLDLGVGSSIVIPLGEKAISGILVGARAGYLFSPFGGMSWSSNELPIQGGPSYSPGGFYFRLSLGLGSYE